MVLSSVPIRVFRRIFSVYSALVLLKAYLRRLNLRVEYLGVLYAAVWDQAACSFVRIQSAQLNPASALSRALQFLPC